MKRPVFIIIGAVAILILMAVWVYVLFFSSTSSEETNQTETFANLDLGDTSDPNYVPPPTTVNTGSKTITDVSEDMVGLFQLTTLPVIGYQEVQKDASSTAEVYYVEPGSGHVYSINLKSGETKKISRTTIPAASKAAITPNGKYIMFQSGNGLGKEFSIGIFSTSSDTISTGLITDRIVDFTPTTDNTFLYSAIVDGSLVGKHYIPATDKIETLFTLPFREATIAWGNNKQATHYSYPKASYRLEGFVYEISSKGTLTRLPVDGYGLSAIGTGDYVLFSSRDGDFYTSNIHQINNNTSNEASITTLPEKCTGISNNSTYLVCGAAIANYGYSLPDRWYQGLDSFADDLWLVNLDTNSARLLSAINNESGRLVDVVNLKTNNVDHVYFQNKLDQTLWLFISDTTLNE